MHICRDCWCYIIILCVCPLHSLSFASFFYFLLYLFLSFFACLNFVLLLFRIFFFFSFICFCFWFYFSVCVHACVFSPFLILFFFAFGWGAAFLFLFLLFFFILICVCFFKRERDLIVNIIKQAQTFWYSSVNVFFFFIYNVCYLTTVQILRDQISQIKKKYNYEKRRRGAIVCWHGTATRRYSLTYRKIPVSDYEVIFYENVTVNCFIQIVLAKYL